MTPQASEVLEKALSLSSHERGFLIDRLIESLDEGAPEEGVEEAWAQEIKRRVDDIRIRRNWHSSGRCQRPRGAYSTTVLSIARSYYS